MKIFRLPDLGEGLADAEIREWYVKVGDVVKVDQPLVSMETAKAVLDVPSPYAGKIIELHGTANEVIKTGAPFITYETDEVTADKGSVVGKLETSEKKMG
jgi:2-oxoisovalerate dehydrogenase E2 component (dihydrolipoyl transacylase)